MNPRARLLVVLVLSLSVLAVALLWWQAGRAQAQLRDQVLAEAERRSVHLANAMAGQVDGLLNLLDLELLYLRQEWLRGPEGFDQASSAVLEVLPRGLVTHFSVADALGRIVFHSQAPGDASPIGQQAFFLSLREGEDRLVVSRPLRSPVTGGWSLMVARPLRAQGVFAGTVQLAVSTEFLAQRLGALELSSADVVALIDNGGAFLARSRDNSAAMEQVLPSQRPFLTETGQVRGTFRVLGQVDGTPRTYGWHRVGASGLVTSVGLADASALAPVLPAIARARALTAVFSGVLLAGGAGLAWLLLRVARSEAQSAAARQLRLRLFDHSRVPMVVLDPASFTLIECNDAAVRAYGREDRAEVVGLNALEVSAPRQRDGTPSALAGQQRVAHALREGLTVFEWLHQRPDGEQWDAEVHLMRFEADGRALLQFTLIDTTARQRAERALKASEARLKEAQRIAAIGSWEQDLRTGHVAWSDELFRLLELDPATTTAGYASFIALVHPDDRAAIDRAHRTSIDRREPYELVHRLQLPDGRVKHVRQVGFTEFDGGVAVRGVGTVQDITAVREAEEALRRLNEELEDRVAERTRELSLLNRELESFAYSVSHDLRTPLRSINGYASLLVEDLGERLGAAGRGHLDRIRQAASRMGQLIDALLSLSRVNRAELHHGWVDMSALAHTVLAELQSNEPQRRVRWSVAPGLRAWGDAGLLQVVLENLLGNAWKYTRHGEAAEIRFEALDAPEGGNAFIVIDNGAGFDMRYAAQLFEPFKRLHAPSEFEGTGVGLATVQRVIERHGGWIRGEGEPGRGARMRFGLPAPASNPA